MPIAQRGQRPLAQRDDLGVGAQARARELDLELRDHAPGPRREHGHAVGEQDRLLDVVGHEHHRARLARERSREPLLHLARG